MANIKKVLKIQNQKFRKIRKEGDVIIVEAVKIWFDKNDLPHPKVPKTTKLREERVALFNEYIKNLRQKIKDDIMPNQSEIQGT